MWRLYPDSDVILSCGCTAPYHLVLQVHHQACLHILHIETVLVPSSHLHCDLPVAGPGLTQLHYGEHQQQPAGSNGCQALDMTGCTEHCFHLS